MPLSEAAPGTPRQLEDVIMRCLERDPGRRPASARECAVELEQVIESLGLDELRAWPRGVQPLRRDD